jgi:hypothetical protein
VRLCFFKKDETLKAAIDILNNLHLVDGAKWKKGDWLEIAGRKFKNALTFDIFKGTKNFIDFTF